MIALSLLLTAFVIFMFGVINTFMSRGESRLTALIIMGIYIIPTCLILSIVAIVLWLGGGGWIEIHH